MNSNSNSFESPPATVLLTAPVIPPPGSVSEETKDLLREYTKADDEYMRLQAQVKQLTLVRSNALKAFFEKTKIKRFKYQGELVTIACRGDSYFLRGKNREEPGNLPSFDL